MLTFHSLKILDRRPEGSDAACISLEIPENLRESFSFIPGQHLGIRAKINGTELRRTYSICSGLDEKHLRIGVRAHHRGQMSRYLVHEAKVGDRLDVLTPTGRFFAKTDATARKTYCAYASGSGITPVLSILRNILSEEKNSRCFLFYGNRKADTIMFAEELMALKDRYPARLSLHFLFSREPQEVDLFNGRLDRDKIAAIGKRLFDPQAIDAYYLCGPGSMIESVFDGLLALGADSSRIHSERFASDPQAPLRINEDNKDLPASQGSTQVTITMDGRRRSFTMARGGTPVLDAAESAGLELPYSCRAGVCSTCRVKVVKGTVSMATNYALEPWELEQGYTLCCQALPTTPELELTYDER